MNNNGNVNQKLQEIASKLTRIIQDEEIKVLIDNTNRTISFLNFSFAIPDPNDKEQYILIWDEIFAVFESEKKKIEGLRQLEIFKAKMKKEAEKKEKASKKEENVELSYTQNLSYIQSIIETNSNFEEAEEVKSETEFKEKENAVPGFRYGVKISENDLMNNSDWFDLEEGQTEFVILTATKNGKMDRKFKNYLKKCRKHSLYHGAFFEGTSVNLSEAKRELIDIASTIELYDIKGPIIYEINNKAVTEFEGALENVTGETLKTLGCIVEACKYIINELTIKGYKALLNIDLNTISILVETKKMKVRDLPLVYNVLPHQAKQLDDNCQIIEFNPKSDYEKIKLSSSLFEDVSIK